MPRKTSNKHIKVALGNKEYTSNRSLEAYDCSFGCKGAFNPYVKVSHNLVAVGAVGVRDTLYVGHGI